MPPVPANAEITAAPDGAVLASSTAMVPAWTTTPETVLADTVLCTCDSALGSSALWAGSYSVLRAPPAEAAGYATHTAAGHPILMTALQNVIPSVQSVSLRSVLRSFPVPAKGLRDEPGPEQFQHDRRQRTSRAMRLPGLRRAAGRGRAPTSPRRGALPRALLHRRERISQS